MAGSPLSWGAMCRGGGILAEGGLFNLHTHSHYHFTSPLLLQPLQVTTELYSCVHLKHLWWPDAYEQRGAAPAPPPTAGTVRTEVSFTRTQRRNICVGCDSRRFLLPLLTVSTLQLYDPSKTLSFCLAAHPASIRLAKSVHFVVKQVPVSKFCLL